MKQFHSFPKDAGYLLYRLIQPIVDPVDTFTGITKYPGYIKDLFMYSLSAKNDRISVFDMYPILRERTKFTSFDPHYYFQTVWFLKEILKQRPVRHVDVGSAYQLSGILSLITKTEFVDIRPIDTRLKNLRIVRGDILHLPYHDNSIPSLSSLHVIEHIGLGRYGDPLDPMGTAKACKELSRVLRPGGTLYVSLPVGKKRVCFNAHRVYPPEVIMDFFDTLKLAKFAVVDDNGRYRENQNPLKYQGLSHGCGMFCFVK